MEHIRVSPSTTPELIAAGQFEAAEAVCRATLEHDPGHFDSLLTLGSLLYRSGRSEESLKWLERAVKLDGTSVAALRTLGAALYSIERYDHAIRCFERVTNLLPHHLQAKFDLALAVFKGGRPEAAESLLRLILESRPDDPDLLFNLAIIVERLSRRDEAIGLYRRAIHVRPGFDQAHANLSHMLNEYGQDGLGHPNDLVAALRDPGHVSSGVGMEIEADRAAAALDPTNADAFNALAHSLALAGRLEQAVEAARTAAAIAPERPLFLHNLGVALLYTNQPDEAVHWLEQACALEPDNLQPRGNLNWALRSVGRVRDVLEAAEFTLCKDPSNWLAQYQRCDALLLAGEYQQGFAAYNQAMREVKIAAQSVHLYSGMRFGHRSFRAPRWQGDAISGHRMLVYADHGLGDAIQMLRFLRPAKERSEAEIVFEGPRELLPLVMNDPSVSERLAQLPDRKEPRGDYDCVIGLMDLAGMFVSDIQSVTRSVPYVSPPADRIAAWRQRLKGHEVFRIGICWTGAHVSRGVCWTVDPLSRWNVNRSCRLADFAGLAAIPGVQLFSLQVGHGAKQLDEMPSGMSIVDLAKSADGFDFAETAAAMLNLDLIVTVDTATAHLAGALGLPAFVLISDVPYWTWMRDRSDSPWYPTVKLARQEIRGDWSGAFATVEKEVRALLGESGTRPI